MFFGTYHCCCFCWQADSALPEHSYQLWPNLSHLFICYLQGVRNVLSQAYADANQVTDELVDCILQPGLQVSPAATEHSLRAFATHDSITVVCTDFQMHFLRKVSNTCLTRC